MKIIKLNNTSFNKERFESFSNKENCEHKKGLTFDDDNDFVECDTCSFRFSLHDFMVWWTNGLGGSKLKLEMYNIRNAIYFLGQEKQHLEDEINNLKKEKTSLKREVNKMKKL